ncbi:MAG TPA: GNAT family N-acetyltransferase [Actinomycetaceae bacterium]|nr:GNAT family N-acetyltransferase [Actinomycetaceae bacterium]
MRIRPGGLEDAAAIFAAGMHINTRIKPEGMVVAEDDDDRILGFAYRFCSKMHPSRYWATVRVRDDVRRRGIGRALIAELGRDRKHEKPFYLRLPEDNPSVGWIMDLGGRVFQQSPPMELDLVDDANRAWFDQLPDAPKGVTVAGADTLDDETILTAFLDTYRWVHDDWSPAASRDYIASVYGPDLRFDLERDVSSFAVRDLGGPEQRVVGGIWAFEETSTRLDAVGEAVGGDDPDADQLVAACLKRVARVGAEKGYDVLAMDGYASDRHMYPLVSSAPKVGGTNLIWVEYDVPQNSDGDGDGGGDGDGDGVG